MKVRVRYKDNSGGSFTVSTLGKTFAEKKNNSGEWKLAEFTTDVSANVPKIEIRAVGNNLVLHMVEVLRGKNDQVGVLKSPHSVSPASRNGMIVQVFDMWGRMLPRPAGRITTTGIAPRIQKTCGAGCYLVKTLSDGDAGSRIAPLIIDE